MSTTSKEKSGFHYRICGHQSSFVNPALFETVRAAPAALHGKVVVSHLVELDPDNTNHQVVPNLCGTAAAAAALGLLVPSVTENTLNKKRDQAVTVN